MVVRCRRVRRAAVVGFVSVVASLLAFSTAAAQAGAYGDVPGDAYYSQPVAELAAQGVFVRTECAEGFCPGEPIDRKTMSVWVIRILDGEDPAPVSQTRFDDVAAASFYAPFIERMAELGVTRGCGDGSGFCPDRTVSRAQMAAFLSRAYGLSSGPDPGFSDVPNDAWYAADVARLAASGITKGCGDGTRFCPDRDTTRAQMATFLWRAENPGELEESADEEEFSAVMDGGGVIAVGQLHGCALRSDQTITCWGWNGSGQASAPAGTFLAVTAGDFHTCGLRTDQSITCWGDDRGTGLTSQNILSAPSGTFTAVAAGSYHTCGLRTDQSISCWGRNARLAESSQTFLDPPSGTFLSVAAGEHHSCAIRTDGTVTCWGSPFYGELNAPAGRFTSVTAAHSYSCGLGADQTITCWGSPIGSTPTGTFTAVTAGSSYACGLRTDGTVTCWGEADKGQNNIPSGVFTAINASDATCGLRAENAVICWGDIMERWGDIVEHQTIVLGSDGGDDEPADDAEETPSDDETEPPGAPRNVRIDWMEGHRLTVHWQAPDIGGDVAHDQYAVQRVWVGGGFPSTWGLTGRESVPSSYGLGRGYGWSDQNLRLDLDFVRSFLNVGTGSSTDFVSRSPQLDASNFTHDGRGNYSLSLVNGYTSHPFIQDTVAVRVIAFNHAGFAVSDEVDVPSQAGSEHDTLRAFVEQLVSKYRGAVPWLGEIWDYISLRDYFVFRDDGFGFNVGYAQVRIGDCDGLSPVPCGVGTEIGVKYDGLLGSVDDIGTLGRGYGNAEIASHELAHIYTLSNDAARNPLAVVAGHLYMLDLLMRDPTWTPEKRVSSATGAGLCSSSELYADLAQLLVMEQGDPVHIDRIPSPLAYWSGCASGGDYKTSAEAIAVARSSLSGQVPRWFHDTYRTADGNYDLHALWADVSVLDQSAIVFARYALRDHFGGYCSDSWDVSNPWRDGGCGAGGQPDRLKSVTLSVGSSAQGRPGCSSQHCRYLLIDLEAPAGFYDVECWSGGSSRPWFSGRWHWPASPLWAEGGCWHGHPGGQAVWAVIGGVKSNEVTWGQAVQPTRQFTAVSAGHNLSCGIRTDQTISCWGAGTDGPDNYNAPPAGSFSAVSLGSGGCGIKTDGTLQCWGSQSFRETRSPAGTFTAVSVGYNNACGLKTDGTIACWGDNRSGESDPPSGTFTAVSAASGLSCGLRADGTVACWGSDLIDESDESDAPSGQLDAVSAGQGFACGIRTDQTMGCWGTIWPGAQPPTGTFTTVSASDNHACGIRTDQIMVCWGANHYQQSRPPGGKYSTVSAGSGHTCALRIDGSAECWGSNNRGQSDVPSDAP